MVANRHTEQTLIRKRTEIVFLLFLAGVLALGCRLAYLQWVQGRGFAELADRMEGRTVEIEAQRGRIKDRSGAELATDVLGKSININPRLVKDPSTTAARLGELLSLPDTDRKEIQEKLTHADARHTFYCQLRRGVERRLALKIAELAKKDPTLRGIWLEDSPMRVNPSGADGIQLIGTVNTDRHGIEALELSMDPILRGTDGVRRVRVNAAGKPIPGTAVTLVKPVDGHDVRLTLDRDIQHFVEQELAKVAGEQQPDAATAIVMDVRTGRILAMASWPSYQPGQKDVTQAERRNRAITDAFEPGSIFKVMTAAAALEYGVPCHFYCSGSWSIGKRTIHCASGEVHGSVDMGKMIEQSCNIAAGHLALAVGPERLHAFLVKMGFHTKTGVEFPGEERGWLRSADKWRTMNTANIGFGQGVTITPIQLLAAYSAIANDGVYNPPRLTLEAPGVKDDRKPRRVMSVENARTLRGYMERVVTSGTGKKAKIAGYNVAGKTGTAQIAEHGSYAGHGYVASFAGFLPASNPQIGILVSVWHPRHGQFGGTVSAPVFREIARQTVDYLRIPPDAPNDLRDGANEATFRRYARDTGGGRGRTHD